MSVPVLFITMALSLILFLAVKEFIFQINVISGSDACPPGFIIDESGFCRSETQYGIPDGFDNLSSQREDSPINTPDMVSNFSSLTGQTTITADELLKLGESLYQQGNVTDALEYYDRVLDMEPNNKGAIYDKALALDVLGKHEDAIVNYDKLLSVEPDNVNALVNKGAALADMEEYQEAIEYFDKVLSIDPSHELAAENKELAVSLLENKGLVPHAESEASVEFYAMRVHDDRDLARGEGEWVMSATIANRGNVEETVALSYPNSGLERVTEGETILFDTSKTTATVPVNATGDELRIHIQGYEDDGDHWYDRNDPIGSLFRTHYVPISGEESDTCNLETSSTGDFTLAYQIKQDTTVDVVCPFP